MDRREYSLEQTVRVRVLETAGERPLGPPRAFGDQIVEPPFARERQWRRRCLGSGILRRRCGSPARRAIIGAGFVAKFFGDVTLDIPRP